MSLCRPYELLHGQGGARSPGQASLQLIFTFLDHWSTHNGQLWRSFANFLSVALTSQKLYIHPIDISQLLFTCQIIACTCLWYQLPIWGRIDFLAYGNSITTNTYVRPLLLRILEESPRTDLGGIFNLHAWEKYWRSKLRTTRLDTI